MNALLLRWWPAVLAVGASAVPVAVAENPTARLAAGSVAGPVAPRTLTDPLAGPLVAPVWLCRPGQPDNPCGQDITGTATAFAVHYLRSGQRVVPDTVSAVDGTRTSFVPPDAPGVDCFSVYPTVDWLPNPTVRVGGNPPRPTDTDMAVALVQVSPLLSTCRLFVPLYRQAPLPALVAAAFTGIAPDYRLGQSDIDQAWHTYWARDNRDPTTGRRRGVVLLGHSQGSAVLASLIRREIEVDVEQRSQIIAAVLLGGNIQVPTDRPAGGGGDPDATFQYLPACERGSASMPVPTRCVVAYSSFRQPGGEPVPPDALFGRATAPGHRILCTNPAALLTGRPRGATTPADTRVATTRLVGGNAVVRGGHLAVVLLGRNPPDLPAGFAAYPGLITTRCASARDDAGTADWLQVDRPDEVLGRPESGRLGLHILDYNVALGNITTLVAEQSAAWIAAYGSKGGA
ncbi:MAG: DUF3089 domain-containing protein [Pseudonocardiaceae bacterium]